MQDKEILELIEKITKYANDADVGLVEKAYYFGKKAHDGQFRKSGEPYVQHPIEVAYILAGLHTSPSTIAAGLMHDVLEDTDMTKEEMANMFSPEVASIVDGVTKISKLKYMTKEKALAHNHEKLLLAMC